MTEAVYNILLIAVVIIATSILIRYIPLLMKRFNNKGDDMFGKSQTERKAIIDEGLKNLNCKRNWEKEDKDWTVSYDYQNGHFSIRIEPDMAYARLSFLFFFNTNIENVEIVRYVANICNINTEAVRVVYSINEDTGNIDVHLICDILTNKKSVTETLTTTMVNMFSWQNLFIKYFDDSYKNCREINSNDAEKNNAGWKRQMFLVHEQEMTHQNTPTPLRSNETEKITIGEILTNILGEKDLTAVSMSVTSNEGTYEIQKGDIANYDISIAIIADNTFTCDMATIYLTYCNANYPSYKRNLCIIVSSETATDDTLYYRITTTTIPLSPDKCIQVGSNETQATSNSFIAAYDITPSKQRLDEFVYIWKEAMAKQRNGEIDKMSDEEKFICNISSQQLSYYLYWGNINFSQKRYYEASRHFENAYNMMLDEYETIKKQIRRQFFDVCYRLGFCYNELHIYAKACYYLGLTLETNNMIYTQEYINALVNSKDIRAISIIDNMIDLSNQVASKDERYEDGEETRNNVFMNFLLRRKAFIFINRQKYDEAEYILKLLLNDPSSSDFAINELAYIKKIKDKGNKTLS